MKKTNGCFFAVIGTAVAFAGLQVLAQGALTPPGAPAPTMKTLTQVEPRIPIFTAPYTISVPGSYYLTTNVVTTGNGVVIQTNNVTLDLMGFSIKGDAGFSDMGVSIVGQTNAPCRNIVVRNGFLENLGYGVYLRNTQGARIEYLSVSMLNRSGFAFASDENGACNGNTIANCSANFGGHNGLEMYARSDGQCNGNMIIDCSFSGFSLNGVLFERGAGTCSHNVLTRCVLIGNLSDGVEVYDYLNTGSVAGNTFESCTVSDNGGYGFRLGGVYGPCDGNRIYRCTVSGNVTRGIYLLGGSANVIENNLVTGTSGSSTGIYVSTAAGDRPNLIIQNTCIGQTNNFSIYGDNVYGPIVTTAGALSTTNGAAGLSPWANFSH